MDLNRVHPSHRHPSEVLPARSTDVRKQINPEPSLRPYGDATLERGGASPHLSDYWQVVLSRLCLVLLVFGVTTASAIFAVSRQRVYYQSRLSLQVNDPAQPARGPVQPGRISGLDIFVDPIESEIQVLRSGETEQRDVERSVEQLRRLGVRVFGAALTEVATTTTEKSYYLQYYYAYQPTDNVEEEWAKLRKGLSRARFWSNS
jgi:hypothetical protein